MKQGNNFIISTNINYDLDAVEYIDFIFVQNDVRKIIKYPSTLAVRKQSTNVVEIYWDYHTTYLFSSKQYVQMDTHIKLLESDTPPQTSISTFRLAPTLFTEYEIVNGMVESETDEDDPPRIIEAWVNILNEYKTEAAASATAAAADVQLINDKISNLRNKNWELKGEWTDPNSNFTIDLNNYTELCILGNLTCTSTVTLNTNVAELWPQIGDAGDKTIYGRWENSPFGIDCIFANSVDGLNATNIINSNNLISTSNIASIALITELNFNEFADNISSCDLKIYAR